MFYLYRKCVSLVHVLIEQGWVKGFVFCAVACVSTIDRTGYFEKKVTFRAWASEGFFPWGGTRGFKKNFLGGGKKFWNFILLTRNYDNNLFSWKFHNPGDAHVLGVCGKCACKQTRSSSQNAWQGKLFFRSKCFCFLQGHDTGCFCKCHKQMLVSLLSSVHDHPGICNNGKLEITMCYTSMKSGADTFDQMCSYQLSVMQIAAFGGFDQAFGATASCQPDVVSRHVVHHLQHISWIWHQLYRRKSMNHWRQYKGCVSIYLGQFRLWEMKSKAHYSVHKEPCCDFVKGALTPNKRRRHYMFEITFFLFSWSILCSRLPDIIGVGVHQKRVNTKSASTMPAMMTFCSTAVLAGKSIPHTVHL